MVTRVWKEILDLSVLGVLHKPRIAIIPDPFPPGESGLATRDYQSPFCIANTLICPRAGYAGRRFHSSNALQHAKPLL